MPLPAESLEQTLDLGPCKVEHFATYGAEEDTWGGTVRFFGYPHHFMAIRVKLNDENIWVGTNDPYERLEGYYHLYDSPPIPARIPGLDGEFVILIHPHGD